MGNDCNKLGATATPQPAGGLRPEPQASQPIGAHQAQGGTLTLGAELARMQAFFQLRSICLHMGVEPPTTMEGADRG